MMSMVELVMNKRAWAVFFAAVFACLPVMFWLSAAIVGLVVLRKGVKEGLIVLAWALLPSMFWAGNGQFIVSIVLVTVAVMSIVLRETGSWHKALLSCVPIGVVVSLSLDWFKPAQLLVMIDMVQTLVRESDVLRPMLESYQGSRDNLLQSVIIGIVVWFYLAGAVIALCLARFWQARLYYPKGFGIEFKQLRLPMVWGLVLLIMLGGVFLFPVNLVAAILPTITLPFFIVGISLVHSLLGVWQLGGLGIGFFYVILFLLMQFVYPFLVFVACLDCVLDFRDRWFNKPKVEQ